MIIGRTNYLGRMGLAGGVLLAIGGLAAALPLFQLAPDNRSAHLGAIGLGVAAGCGIALIGFSLRQRLARIGAARSLLLSLGAVSGIVAVSCLLAATAYGATEHAHFLRLLGGTIAGIAIACAATAFHETITRTFEGDWFYVAGGIAAFSLLIGIHWCGMRQFGGFDHSMVIDSGWRLLRGQHAAMDFPATTPVSFFMGAYYAYALFGVKWEALILGCGLFSVVMFTWMLWLVPQLIANRWHSFVIALCSQALCVLPVSYWWYNPISTAIAAVFAVSAYAWLLNVNSFRLAISYGCALFLVASVKANIAGLLILPVTAILLTSRPHRVRVLLVSSVAFLAFIAWLGLNRINLITLLHNYTGVSGRAFEAGPFFADPRGFEALVAVIMAIYVLLPVAAAFSVGKLQSWRGMGIALFTTLAGLDNFIAAGETKLVDIGLILIGVILALHAMGGWAKIGSVFAPRLQFAAAYVMMVALITSCSGVAIAATRHRVRGIGPGMFYEYDLQGQPLSNGFFEGVRAGPRFHRTYAELAALIQSNTGRRVFFGPRMQWGYAAFGLPSPLHQPVWWHPGTSFSLNDLRGYVDEFQRSSYDVLIFLKNDMTFYPAELITWIKSNYIEDEAFSELSIYRSPSIPAPAGASDQISILDNSGLGRMITTLVTIDVPPVAPGAEYGTKVRLPGVRSEDQLLLSPTQFSGSWGVYYQTTDTVTVNYTNTTAGPQDPPRLIFRVTAIQTVD